MRPVGAREEQGVSTRPRRRRPSRVRTTVGQWEWPEELDALVAAPDHHHLLLENERVRVLETVIPARETTAIHTHRWPNVQYVVSAADFVRRDGDGRVTLDTRTESGPPKPKPSAVSWSGPIPPHSLESVDDVELCVIMVELKDGVAVEPA